MKLSSFASSLLATTGILLASGAVAEAASIGATTTFHLNGSYKKQSSLTYVKDGLTLTAKATDEDAANRDVVRTLFGLGVTTFGDDALNGSDNQIDGLGPDEILNLYFDNPIKLISATFGAVGSNDDYKIFVDGNKLTSGDFPYNGYPTVSFTNINENQRTGTVIGFSVKDKNDDYYLKKITVEKAHAVPEPLTILGTAVVLGFGGLCQHQTTKKCKQAKAMSV